MFKLSFKRITLSLILSLFIVLFCWGFLIEPGQIIIKRETIEVFNWPPEYQNFKIAVISDIHAGAPFIGIRKIKKIVELTNKEKPDIVLMTGDFIAQTVIGGKVIEPEKTAKILGNLKSKYGIVATLGNQDWKYNGKRVAAALEKNHIPVLENNAIKIVTSKKPFWVAGLADLTTRYPDLNATLEKIPQDNTVIMLSHHPDMFRFIPERISLIISGHTHGGQVKLPFIGRLIVPSLFEQRYAIGHVAERNRHLFVSSGIGTSKLGLRFGVTPEINILTLKSPQKNLH